MAAEEIYAASGDLRADTTRPCGALPDGLCCEWRILHSTYITVDTLLQFLLMVLTEYMADEVISRSQDLRMWDLDVGSTTWR